MRTKTARSELCWLTETPFIATIILTSSSLGLNVHPRHLLPFEYKVLDVPAVRAPNTVPLLTVCLLVRTTASLSDQCSAYCIPPGSDWLLAATPPVDKNRVIAAVIRRFDSFLYGALLDLTWYLGVLADVTAINGATSTLLTNGLHVVGFMETRALLQMSYESSK